MGIAEQQHGLHVLNVSNNNLTPGGMEHMAIMLVSSQHAHTHTERDCVSVCVCERSCGTQHCRPSTSLSPAMHTIAA